MLIVLFILCVGTLTWTFWPLSAETLYQRGAVLMASDDPDDWDLARDSADMADVLVSMIDDKIFEITGTTSFYGQYKRIWGRVVAELSAEYYKRYREYAEAS